MAMLTEKFLGPRTARDSAAPRADLPSIFGPRQPVLSGLTV